MLHTYSAVMSVAANSDPPAAVTPIIAARPSDDELDEFVTTLKTQVKIFVNRLKSNSSGGRPTANNFLAGHEHNGHALEVPQVHPGTEGGLQDKITQ